MSRHLEGVNAFSCREGESIVAIRIALVVVNDGIGKVDGVGHAGLEGIEQGNGDSPAICFNLRLLDLWRRNDHPFRRVVNLHDFIKLYRDLLHIFLVDCTELRRGVNHLGGCLIVRTAIGRTHTGTCQEECTMHNAQCIKEV